MFVQKSRKHKSWFYAMTKDISTVKAPVKNIKSPHGYDMVDLEMIDPHALIAHLFNEAGVSIEESKVGIFWKHHQEVKSPFFQAFDGTDGHIPVGLYGDGARARQQAYMPPEKVVGIFINLPLWRPKSSRHSRFLLFSIEEDLCFVRKTINAIYRRITWSLNHAFFGRWPLKGPDGEILSGKAGQLLTPDGKRFVLTEHRGDWNFFKWVLGFRSSWIAGKNVPVCYRCAAYAKGAPNQHYYHVGENAWCWDTEYNRTRFLAEETPTTDPSFWTVRKNCKHFLCFL